ncbi:BA14K family protein [Oricola sp.]|uniref:BA14K family protein n=1 Tax=Oricola sp. TaxID=1979950 RepID=UPI0025EDCFCA|nr:BA14K family protein [Oricola sp.]MCI5077129.1 BA14K family protein [Oricola sp.]
MKRFLMVIAGFVTTSVVFAAGASVAMVLFLVDPEDGFEPGQETAALWNPNPNASDVRVISTNRFEATDEADLEDRLAESDAGKPVLVASLATPVLDEPEAMTDASPALPEAHLAWCSGTYRSYDASSNTYTPYGGGTETCVSPYLDGTATASTEPVQVADNGAPRLTEAHIRDCMNRYRSYRVSDNTYQPYGDVPRRECVRR